ncbi:MAG: AMP-binding protein, partial [Chthoniobacteraceae bacterium]
MHFKKTRTRTVERPRLNTSPQIQAGTLTSQFTFAYAAPITDFHPSDMNLTELLDRTAADWPDKMAMIEGDSTVSYSGLLEMTLAFKAQLEAFQLPPGCRVGICFPNSISYVALTFASWRINAV